MSVQKPDLERMSWDIGFVTPDDVLDLIRLARAARAYLTPWPVNDDPDGALFTELVAAADAFTDSAEAK